MIFSQQQFIQSWKHREFIYLVCLSTIKSVNDNLTKTTECSFNLASSDVGCISWLEHCENCLSVSGQLEPSRSGTLKSVIKKIQSQWSLSTTGLVIISFIYTALLKTDFTKCFDIQAKAGNSRKTVLRNKHSTVEPNPKKPRPRWLKTRRQNRKRKNTKRPNITHYKSKE